MALKLSVLKELGSTPEVMDTAIFEQEQITRAIELGLGVNAADKIEIIAGDDESADYAEKIGSILYA